MHLAILGDTCQEVEVGGGDVPHSPVDATRNARFDTAPAGDLVVGLVRGANLLLPFALHLVGDTLLAAFCAIMFGLGLQKWGRGRSVDQKTKRRCGDIVR